MKLSLKFILLIIVFYFGDLLSTYYMLGNGWYEVNPLGVYDMVLAKTMLLIAIYLGSDRLMAWHPFNLPYGRFLSQFVYGFLIIGGGLAMANNFGVLKL